jgi:hypothetical protein
MSAALKNILFAVVILLSIAGPIGMFVWIEQLPLPSGGTVCEGSQSTFSRYYKIIFVADLPDVPSLATQSGNRYLDLGFVYRSAGQNTFVLNLTGAHCGEIVDAVSLAKLIGTNRFDSAFIVPENPSSRWPMVFPLSVIFLFVVLYCFLGIVSDRYSKTYPGKWLLGRWPVFIPDDPNVIKRDVRKWLRMKPLDETR